MIQNNAFLILYLVSLRNGKKQGEGLNVGAGSIEGVEHAQAVIQEMRKKTKDTVKNFQRNVQKLGKLYQHEYEIMTKIRGNKFYQTTLT